MANRPEISVVTAHRDNPEVLEKLAAALESQKLPADSFEWVVVDDGSLEGPPPLFEAYEGPLHLVKIILKQNAGRAVARNRALDAAAGEIIVLLDADTLPWPGCLERMVNLVRETGAVIIGRRDPHPELPRDAITRYLHTRGGVKHRDGDRVPGKYFYSSLSALPKALLDEVGRFDESYTAWGGEDLDLGLRLEDHGASFLYSEKARAWHFHWRGWDEIEEMHRVYGRSGVLELLRRHPDPSRYLGLDRLLPPETAPNLSKWLERWITQRLLSDRLYGMLGRLVRLLPSFPWPDLLFDYLFFYQYTGELRALGDPYLAKALGSRSE